MRFVTLFGVIGMLTGPVFAQGAVVPDAGALQAQIAQANAAAQAAQQTAAQASQAASTAQGAAASAQTSAQRAQTTASSVPVYTDAQAVAANAAAIANAVAPLVKSVNGVAPTAGAVTVAIPAPADLSSYAKTADVNAALSTAVAPLAKAADVAATYAKPSDIAAAIAPLAKSVNGVAAVSGAVTIPVTQFVAGFTPTSPGTVANLLANQPCTTALMGQYAVVSNLWSGGSQTNEVMRCGSSGSTAYWRPQRSDYSATVAYTGGAMTLSPLVTPPIMYLTGTTTSNGTITPSTVNAYPGEQFVIVQSGAVGALLTLQIGGLVGGVLNLVSGGTRTLTYSCTAANVCAWNGT